jgi:energy-coupling factor transporter ATP-binding protein EcfA2
MRIALIGAPGSGKSELAKALEDKLDGDVGIVDDYMDEVQEYSRFVLDEHATYIGNLYILLGRYAKERLIEEEVKSCCDHLISCGTLVETTVYTSLEAVNHQDDVHWVRVQNMMNIIGTFFQDTWRYDHTFVLQLPNPDTDDIAGKVDRHLFMAINSFGIHYTPIDGSLDERVAKVLEAIKKDDDETPTPDEQ